jgi:diaminopimelate epimerase
MHPKIQFTKMQGTGNDFIVVDAINQRWEVTDTGAVAAALCDRHFGIGADGLILVLPSQTQDFKMRIFNADGSEPEMCGNGIRCFAKFVHDAGLSDLDVFSVETMAGPIVPALLKQDGVVVGVEVDMGEPRLQRKDIPMGFGDQTNRVVNEPLAIQGEHFLITGVSMGNPHAVIFCPDLSQVVVADLGPQIEIHPLFPEKTNVEFVQIISATEAKMQVWERGSGETLACGTGACAVLVAGVLTQRLSRKATIHLPGGSLGIEWQESNNHVIMSGPVKTVFTGQFSLNMPN